MVLKVGRLRVFVDRGWVGTRFDNGRYYILRNRSLHPPLFSERYGYLPFHSFARLGAWELGWK